MRPTASLLKAASSSKQWLSRQARDPYVKARSQNLAQYRSRSAFKLLQLNERFKLFGPGRSNVVIDLGAAPGGWSQVVANSLGLDDRIGRDEADAGKSSEEIIEDILSGNESGLWSSSSSALPNEKGQENTTSSSGKTVIAVDILAIAPIRGVRTVRQNFLDPKADEYIASLLPSKYTKADLVLSDIAVNMSGNKIKDSQACIDVRRAVFRFASKYLKEGNTDGGRGGHLVLKYFADEEAEEFREQVLKPVFRFVYVVKPDASRSESSENYFVCKNFLGASKLFRSST